MTDAHAIEAIALTRTFGEHVAVNQVNLVVKRGEIYGFLGPNGAGKSTPTRILCTLTAPTGGRASVAGYDVAREPGQVRLRIGAALQSAALDVQQTGAELLRQQGRYYGLTNGEIVAFLRFETAVQEIFAVTVLPGRRFPDLINDDDTLLQNSFVVPDAALADVPATLRAGDDPRTPV